MKSITLALCAAILVLATGAQTSSAIETGAPALLRLALILEATEGLRGVVEGDRLLIRDRADDHHVCTIEMESGDALLFNARGEMASDAAVDGAVDMRHLDAASVGVLTLDRAARTWSLSHRVSPSLATIEQLRGVVRHFAAAAEQARTRFAGESR